ncbi:MAG: hypothetical protein HC806_06840, partial [Anaerolineae bacterium]|nr:hypothetical protein [Anaerolineae bacterium]
MTDPYDYDEMEENPSDEYLEPTPEPELQSLPGPSYRERFNQLREDPRVWQGKVLPAFWTIASTISMATTVILIIVLIVLVKELFTLKSLIGGQLLGGLQTNFERMDAATIKTTVVVDDTITVDDTIPVQFTLTLNQNTTVTLTESTAIPNTIVAP